MASPHTPRPRFDPRNDHPASPTVRSQQLAAPSPILTTTRLDPSASTPLSPTHPQYAEVLTPLKLRRRGRRHVVDPSTEAGPSSIPLAPGPSKEGYYTDEGDLYRGTAFHPLTGLRHVEEDAITLGGSSTTSTSSSWSWGSGNLERGRKATLAVFGRVGEALRARRGSASSATTDDTASTGGGVRRRISRRLSRSTTRDSSPERPKRQRLPKRREFTLLLPPKDGETEDAPFPASALPTPGAVGSQDFAQTSYPPDRVITTPELPTVLERIKNLRAASGHFPDGTPPATPTTTVPIRRGGSGLGRIRPRARPAPGSFTNPPVPRPAASRTRSRVEVLRGSTAQMPTRPKSVSDLMGMTNPYGSSASLSQMNEAASTPPTPSAEEPSTRGCWWLDVACPGWEDLRDIGELLGLHPLTLEDVLQQDPREKLDMFDRLGYYFVVVRALDEGYFQYTPGSASSLVGAGQAVERLVKPHTHSPELRARDEGKKEGRRRGWGMGRASGKHAIKDGEKVEIVEDNPGKEGLEGVGVGAVNVYLVVFADGIVSFHFEDITKHTRRVLDRILSNASAREAPGSDWIAHGILDSIVDAFFPLCRYVDGAVDDLDSLAIDPSVDPRAAHTSPTLSPQSSLTAVDDEIEMSEKVVSTDDLGEKNRWVNPISPAVNSARRRVTRGVRAYLPSWSIHLPRQLIYIRLFFLPISSAERKRYDTPETSVIDKSTMIKRTTDMRKLVTGLTRLLGQKSQVIAKLRKRAAESGGGVEAYIGDVEDHVLLLQTSLYHYEYILSQCQPAYISHLQVSYKLGVEKSNTAILALSTVTIGILPMQFITGLFSMNINIPQEGSNDGHLLPDGSEAGFRVFGGIVAAIFVVICLLVSIVRWWRWNARVKWAQMKNDPLPNAWDGYWGWK